ncbi:hypothetical protein CJF30_00002966 [Rutstroemia sp. NJR-2017a BBW]|nr:hypothetical protein CJF30_00002966 [Rutstroemia sp. NJR-2017a BBW]
MHDCNRGRIEGWL